MRFGKIVSMFGLVLILGAASPVIAQQQRAPVGKDALLAAVHAAAAEVVASSKTASLTFHPAQSSSESQRRTGLYKVIGGIGLAGAGVLLAATSGEHATVTVDGPFGSTTIEGSSRSTGKLVAGLAMIGGGSLLAILGVNDRND